MCIVTSSTWICIHYFGETFNWAIWCTLDTEDLITRFIHKRVPCKKEKFLHYISPVSMSDYRMLPKAHPFEHISVDPIAFKR